MYKRQAQIYEAVWNEPAFKSEKTVTVHIKNIRDKIEINTKDPKYIKVVYGLGYKVDKIYVQQFKQIFVRTEMCIRDSS